MIAALFQAFGVRRRTFPLERDGPDPSSGRQRWRTPSQVVVPNGLTLLAVRVVAPRGVHVRVAARTHDDRVVPCYEFAEVARGITPRRLVAIPQDATSLVIEVDDDVVVTHVEAVEMGVIALLAVLGTRWLRRQRDSPTPARHKLGHAVRVVARGGLRVGRTALVAAELSAQEVVADTHLPAPTSDVDLDRARAEHRAARTQALEELLAGDGRLVVPAAARPEVAVVVVTFNRAELTLGCIRALLDPSTPPMELVVVDNGSADATSALLDRLDGAVIIRNRDNLGFVRGVNAGVAASTAERVLLVNSDCEVEPGAIAAAAARLDDPSVGIVGGMLLHLDGSVQEAGSIVWRDGSCRGYGRGTDPRRPEVQFVRDVDFVSGALLLVRRDVWDALGGFDDAYSPGYYEDADLCFRAASLGWRVVYEPAARARHVEHASSDLDAAAALMRRHRSVFVARHGPRLAAQRPAGSCELAARGRPRGRRRILLVDDAVPHPITGSGTGRTGAIVRALVDLDVDVAFYPTVPPSDWGSARHLLPTEVELVAGGRTRLHEVLRARRGLFDEVVVSRPHNLTLVLDARRRGAFDAPVTYDVEALAGLRALARADLSDNEDERAEATAALEREVADLRAADRVIVASARERELLVARGIPVAAVVGHAVPADPTTTSFGGRRDLLFVGPLLGEDAPNVDAVRWFAEHVLPILRTMVSGDLRLVVAGRVGGADLGSARLDGVELLGFVPDLSALFERSRVFVAPTRFAAGIPLKVIEAASRGVPVVASELLVGQLGWAADVDLASAPVTDAGAFARAVADVYLDEARWEALRAGALRRVAAEWSVEMLREALGRGLALDPQSG